MQLRKITNYGIHKGGSNPSIRGNHIIQFYVEMPKILNAEHRELF